MLTKVQLLSEPTSTGLEMLVPAPLTFRPSWPKLLMPHV